MAAAVVLALTKPVPWAQHMIVTQCLLTHCVSKMSFLLFFSLSRLPWESGVTSLILGLLSPLRMFVSPSWIFPSQITAREYHYPFTDEQVPALPQGPTLGRVLFLSLLLVLYVVVALVAVPQLLHGHTVGQSTQSQPVAATFAGKHNTFHLTIGGVVQWLMLAVMLVVGYWKCLTTMGPTLGANFCHGYFSIVHWAHRIEDINTLSCDVYTYLFTSSDS